MDKFERLFKTLTGGLIAVQLHILALLGRAQQPALIRVRNSRRGAGMLEYALVALISIAVFGVLIEQFTGIFSNLAGTIADKLGGE